MNNILKTRASEANERKFFGFLMKKIDLKDRKNENLWESPTIIEHDSQNASERSERAEIFGFLILKDRKIEKFWDYSTITEYDSQKASELEIFGFLMKKSLF